mmetsp:Transcript_18151/g.20948  ORF Transcript_18151/g.20948 Transcript_18151/m.20948 type:complete len:188 (+) Transcript_18151:33-596(+)
MLKRTENKETEGGDSKRSRGPEKFSEHDWIDSINSSGIAACREMQSKLETLLATTKDRISRLTENERELGLAYTGEGEVECGCGNTFKAGGNYAAKCDYAATRDDCPDFEEKAEHCIECVKECNAECGKYVCESCSQICASCEDIFCSDCLTTCCSCEEGFCERDKDCSTDSVGYAGDSCCKGCLER